MNSDVYKKPTKPKNYAGKKRAIILYARQYKKQKTKSIFYQNLRVMQYGVELTFVACSYALAETVAYYNKQYGDNMDIKHGLTILHIKHMCVANDLDLFSAEDFLRFDVHIDKNLGYFVSKRMTLMTLLNDLVGMKFLNKYGRSSYSMTQRIKMFTVKMEQKTKEFLGTDESQ